MGSMCTSCCGNREDDIFENEQSDKSNLLGNPVGEGSRTASQSISNKHPRDGAGDQQATLNKILQKTANNYIDVPALNSPVDHPIDKTKDYESRIQAALRKHDYTESSNLLQDTPHLERILSEEPVPQSDLKMVRDINSSMLNALQSIQIENSENLVIPFNTPKNNL